MTIEIKAPQFNQDMVDPRVTEVYVNAGDTANAEQVIIEIETDKVVVEVSAPEYGKIESLLVRPGDSVESDQLLATLIPLPKQFASPTSRSEHGARQVIASTEVNQPSFPGWIIFVSGILLGAVVMYVLTVF